MLNGQNNFNAGGPPGNGGFPNMVGTQGGAQGMQYGMGPGARGMQGQAPRPTRAASLCPASARKARWAGYGYGRAGGMQSPFGNPMGQGNGLSLGGGLLPASEARPRGARWNARGAGRWAGPPRVAARGQRQRRVRADGRSSRRDDGRRGKLRSARRRHPAADGTRGRGGSGRRGCLLAMINKQQGAPTSQAFGGGAQGNLMGIGGMGSGVGMGGMMGAPDEPAPGFDLNEFPSLGGPHAQTRAARARSSDTAWAAASAWDPDLRWAACSAGWTAWDPPTDTASSRCRSRIPSLLFRMRISPRSRARPGAGRRAQAGRRQGRPIRPAGGTSRPCLAAVPGRSRVSAEAWGRRDPAAGSVSTSGAGISGGWRRTLRRAQGGLGGQYPSLHSQGSGASSQGGYDFGGGGGAGTRSASRPEAKGGVPPKPMGSPDRYGLARAALGDSHVDPDLPWLALGTDLTTLGLNLNSPEPLYKTFGSPWADTPPRPELELLLPACYGVQVSRCHVSHLSEVPAGDALLRLLLHARRRGAALRCRRTRRAGVGLPQGTPKRGSCASFGTEPSRRTNAASAGAAGSPTCSPGNACARITSTFSTINSRRAAGAPWEGRGRRRKGRPAPVSQRRGARRPRRGCQVGGRVIASTGTGQRLTHARTSVEWRRSEREGRRMRRRARRGAASRWIVNAITSRTLDETDASTRGHRGRAGDRRCRPT